MTRKNVGIRGLTRRAVAFAALLVVVATAGQVALHWYYPALAAGLAVAQMTADEDAVARLRLLEDAKNTLTAIGGGVLVLGAVLLFGGPLWRGMRRLRPTRRRAERTLLVPALLALGLAGGTGCAKYDVPEFGEIDTSETGFLIPLEGDTERQTTFESESYLEARKVATKRVQIPHRWVSTGRMPWSGEWIGLVRLVKVDRSPVTREWTADSGSGTSARNQAIWIESKDSVGFSVGFNSTAYIKEENTARFLYMYRSKSLADMMDTEVRARIQSVAAEVAARWDLDELRARKQDIIDEVRRDVIPFFADRGITITTIGMFGGFTYQNASIQEAIDETFVAQQLKVVSKAKFDAQEKENERIELAAQADANRARTIAEGEADAVRKLAQATREAQRDPLFLQLKQLEVETKRVEKWNGAYPSQLMQLGGDQVPQLLLQLPGGGR